MTAFEEEPPTPRAAALVAVAGPVVSLLLGGVFVVGCVQGRPELARRSAGRRTQLAGGHEHPSRTVQPGAGRPAGRRARPARLAVVPYRRSRQGDRPGSNGRSGIRIRPGCPRRGDVDVRLPRWAVARPRRPSSTRGSRTLPFRWINARAPRPANGSPTCSAVPVCAPALSWSSSNTVRWLGFSPPQTSHELWTCAALASRLRSARTGRRHDADVTGHRSSSCRTRRSTTRSSASRTPFAPASARITRPLRSRLTSTTTRGSSTRCGC
jgi:hypothetical protein